MRTLYKDNVHKTDCFSFQINTVERPYFLQAPDQATMDMWIHGLSRVKEQLAQEEEPPLNAQIHPGIPIFYKDLEVSAVTLSVLFLPSAIALVCKFTETCWYHNKNMEIKVVCFKRWNFILLQT